MSHDECVPPATHDYLFAYHGSKTSVCILRNVLNRLHSVLLSFHQLVTNSMSF